MSAATLKIAGLLFGLVGVLILFRYGMPYRVRTGGMVTLAVSKNKDELRLEKRYGAFGYVGIGCLVLATALQIVANLL